MERIKGIACIVIGAMLWGATGPLMEWILNHSSLSVSFMLTLRLFIAGSSLLVFLRIQNKEIHLILKDFYWMKKLVIFAIFGMLGVQYSFVSAIKSSNAIVATFLQFLAPIFVIFFVSWRIKKWPPLVQVIGMIGTLFGLFLLLTNGSISTVFISPKASVWGIVVGISFAFYTLYPAALMKEWGVLLVVGWSMLMGGGILGVVTRIWESREWVYLMDMRLIFLLFVVIIFGTLAFVLFLSSMKYISATETSILSSIEPLTAMVISVIWLNQLVGTKQWVGAICMLFFVTWLSISGKKS